jgi:hypothetical protein
MSKSKRKPAIQTRELSRLARVLYVAKRALRECATTAAAAGVVLAILTIADQFTYRG